MNSTSNDLSTIAAADPRDAADLIARLQARDGDWLDIFSEQLDRRRSAHALANTLALWGLSQSEAARLFGVSRQAIGKWLSDAPPAERLALIADLAAATELLVRYLKRDRIPAVVRRPIPARGGLSMLDVLRAGEARSLPALCREMFDFERAQSR
jgi:transcriptional regulator with XRE-family HTH domain